MLQRLMSEDISRWWPFIKDGLAKSLPRTVIESDTSLSLVLDSLLSGKMQGWLEMDYESTKVKGMVVTGIVVDEFTRVRNLLIFSLYSNRTARPEDWTAALDTLRKYAREKGCYKIIGYTDKDLVESIAEKLGGRAVQTLIEFDLEERRNGR